MKIMILPGTVWQVPLIKKIKSMGHELYITNPVMNNEIVELADHFFQADIFDYDSIVNYCKSEKVDIVMSEECDIATDAIARYNKAIGANCISESMADLFTNKHTMRKFCEKNQFNPIPYKLCTSIEEAKAFYYVYGPKIIMKPIDSNASHGVYTIISEKDIDEKFEKTLLFSRNSKAVLLEKYIEGKEFTVDGIVTRSGHKTLAISKKDHYKHNKNIAKSLYFTQYDEIYDYNMLREFNDTLLNATGLPFGITHVEYKFDENTGKYYLIEMAARGGGNLISAIIVPFMSGIDNYDYLIKASLDSNYNFDISINTDNDRTAILQFMDLPCSGGVVKYIEGEAYLQEEPCIKNYKLNFNIGDYIQQPENDSVRIGYFIICAETRDKFNEVLRNINKKFKIGLE